MATNPIIEINPNTKYNETLSTVFGASISGSSGVTCSSLTTGSVYSSPSAVISSPISLDSNLISPSEFVITILPSLILNSSSVHKYNYLGFLLLLQ